MLHAKRLEWITLAYLLSVVVVMYLVLGSSQAMKTAWLEDILGMFPAVAFLVASRFYYRPPNREYPYGYHRAYGIAYLTGAVSLTAMGGFLAIDSTLSLLTGERPTIGILFLLGHQVWLGWIMILALLYSSLPAIFLGRAKLPLAKALHNKILYTDAETQKADYSTALAAIGGVLGVGLGFWWADAVAAILISGSVLKDGFQNLRAATQDMLDRYPEVVGEKAKDPLIAQVHERVKKWPWVAEARVRFRENGQVYYGEVLFVPRDHRELVNRIAKGREELLAMHWKLHDVTLMPVQSFEDYRDVPSSHSEGEFSGGGARVQG
ncbi:cation transporter [Neolewinella litorea]|uniref:Cation transporter n=2 Tax=Neolewinella litorea TaxID=2562452 RepID=A0A4S4NPX5_9BACT|nr:cation transporter [Neolewinella litorea]